MSHEYCLNHLLNPPGNFTASKLARVKQNEPEVYAKIHKVILPGDFIAMKLSSNITTSISALSEGVFWDFKTDTLSAALMNHYGFDPELIPEIKPAFSEHGKVNLSVAQLLGLKPGIPVAHKQEINQITHYP